MQKKISNNDPTLIGSQREFSSLKKKENEIYAKKIVPQYLHHILNNNGDKNTLVKELKAYKNDISHLKNKLHYEILKLEYLTI